MNLTLSVHFFSCWSNHSVIWGESIQRLPQRNQGISLDVPSRFITTRLCFAQSQSSRSSDSCWRHLKITVNSPPRTLFDYLRAGSWSACCIFIFCAQRFVPLQVLPGGICAAKSGEVNSQQGTRKRKNTACWIQIRPFNKLNAVPGRGWELSKGSITMETI